MSSLAKCEQTLQDAILRGEYATGARLPPERTLATNLGVGRVTVRSALGALVARGLLTARQGSGYVVRPLSHSSAGASLLPELQRLGAVPFRPLVTDLLRLRRHLAAALIEHFAVMDVVETNDIEDAINAMDALPESASGRDLALADRDILQALVSASRSVTFELMLLPVTRVLMEMEQLYPLLYSRPDTNVLAFRAVLAWLKGERVEELPILDIVRARDELTLKELPQ